MRPFLILSLCNRSFAGPALARSKPRRNEWPERERAYRKKGFGSQSGADIRHLSRSAEVWWSKSWRYHPVLGRRMKLAKKPQWPNLV
ncbi:MAG: hypothetical protein E5X40_19120 [Mesorhizobium sp.]|nr:hypothetical protein EOA86_17730 [Mesorhizobium sp. M5C.F.Ca.IN.020.32.2.1]RUV66142.1 hypothetical protein EOA88_31145 [Mesorhizobium sp. M5C.F.Ca.IN.020.14.1.1]RWH41559.1 MAG: hypothetical protein EOQ80_27570 [Mesorhizobium sp.]RWH54466.1 MAG: hypothetical protein EOQ82_18325 [Mesorhizobium sp.]RWI75006.1 MAG: hypothetical protein EOR18_09895 [Mesorhizobium sp.]